MAQESSKPPLVFLSYSHDSREHRLWVADLAARLRSKGVEVILDQLDLSPGEDITAFMEQGLAAADRVLVICTDEYTRKANAGEGGVGYEKMILTAELFRDLGTTKFIPVLRDRNSGEPMPRFMGTRKYIDLSDPDDTASFDELLRELHRVPTATRPPLGRNPFASLPSGEEAPPSTAPTTSIADLRRLDASPVAVYDQALTLAQSSDMVGWRQLVKQVKPAVIADLVEWKRDYQDRRQGSEDVLASQLFGEVVTLASPLMLIACAGIESGRESLSDQRALLDDLITLPDWRGGARPIPATLGFYYQLLHGALCVDTHQYALASRLFTTSVSYGDRKYAPVWKTHTLIGYPPWFPTATGAWNYSIDRAVKWEWLLRVFESPETYRTAVTAYYMSLNLYELAELLGAGRHALLDQQGVLELDIPLCFATESEDICERSMLLLSQQADQIGKAISALGVGLPDIAENWPAWIDQNRKWLRGLLNTPIIGELRYERLPELLMQRSV